MPQHNYPHDLVTARFLEISRIHFNLNRPRNTTAALQRFAQARTWLGWLWLAGISGLGTASPLMAASAVDTVLYTPSSNFSYPNGVLTPSARGISQQRP